MRDRILGSSLARCLERFFEGFLGLFARFLLRLIGEFLHLAIEGRDVALAERFGRRVGARLRRELADCRFETGAIFLVAEVQAFSRDFVAQLGDTRLGLALFHALRQLGAQLLCFLRDPFQPLLLSRVAALELVDRNDALEALELGDLHDLGTGRGGWGRGGRRQGNQAQRDHRGGADQEQPVLGAEHSRAGAPWIAAGQHLRGPANDQGARRIVALRLIAKLDGGRDRLV